MIRIGIALTRLARDGRRRLISTYIYTMLLRRLDISVSGYQRKMYMTNAQLRLAKTGHAFFWISDRDSGVMREEKGCMPGSTESLAMARTTRAKT